MCVFMCFYDKNVYIFHNECADSSKPHWEIKLFSWNSISEHLFYLILRTSYINIETTVENSNT